MRDFHSEHFPSNPHPHVFFYNYSGIDAYAHEKQHDAGVVIKDEKEDDYEEEDDLGYYPDGVKRTLTDEQISMFRHTEIQMLLRDRRRRREEEEEEQQEGEVVEAELHIDEDVDMGVATDQHVDDHFGIDEDCQFQKEVDSDENIKLQPDKHRAEPEMMCKNGSSEDLVSLLSQTQTQTQTQAQSRSQKKRSRVKNPEHQMEGDRRIVDRRVEEEGNIWNFRRRARELDEKEEQRVELEY